MDNIEVWQAEIWDLECSRGCGSFQVSEQCATATRPDCHCPSCGYNSGRAEATGRQGWFYWFCYPGCLPDSEENGPFDTYEAALADARDGLDDDST